jgi:hypothetical protein
MFVAHPEGPYVGASTVVEYRADSLIVLIDWTIIQTEHYGEDISFNIDANPEVILVSMDRMSAELQISYNTQYNVSIIATLCGISNIAATVKLKFGECCMW